MCFFSSLAPFLNSGKVMPLFYVWPIVGRAVHGYLDGSFRVSFTSINRGINSRTNSLRTWSVDVSFKNGYSVLSLYLRKTTEVLVL